MKRHQDKIKEALLPDIPEWDEGGVWAEVEKTLPKKKKRRFFFWIFPAIAGLLTFALWLGFNEVQQAEISAAATQAVAQSTAPKVHAEIAIAKPNSVSRNTEAINSGSSLATEKTKQISSPNSVSEHSISKKVTAESIAVKNSFRQQTPLNVPSDFVSEIFDALSLSVQQQHKNKKQVKHFVDSLLAKTTSSKHRTHWPIIPLFERDSLPGLDKIKLGTLDVPLRKAWLIPRTANLIDLKKESEHAGFMVSTIGTAYLSQRRTTYGTEGAYPDDLRAVEAYDFGILVNKGIKENWSIDLGIIGRQTVELFTYRDTLVSTMPTVSDSAFVVTVNGVQQFIEGETTETSRTPWKSVSPNSLRQLLLPVQLAYTIPLNKFELSFQLGAEFQLASRYKGSIIDGQGNRTSDGALIANRYAYNFGLNALTGGVQLAYPLGKHLNMNFGIRGGLGLWDHYSSEEYTLRYDLLGLRAGVTRVF